jgi:prephenate dehydrogenase
MRIAVVGTGHMGSWLAGLLLFKKHEVAAFDHDRLRLKGLEGVTLLSGPEGLGTFGPSLVINAVSLQNTVAAFREVIPHLPEGCMIADVASIKGHIADFYRESGFRFVSAHPMFGPTFAAMDRLNQENAIVIRESDEDGGAFFRELFTSMGIKVFEYSFDEHDRMMAYSLTIPFVSSMAFAACVKGSHVPGTTFAKHKAIAEGLLAEDDGLLTEILFNTYSLAELDKVTGRLEYLKHILRERDREELGAFFRRLRENLS